MCACDEQGCGPKSFPFNMKNKSLLKTGQVITTSSPTLRGFTVSTAELHILVYKSN